MEQIYYTQCPIGYGLGASNGFQIKRITPGYPLSGDFRHLGLRAFLPGTRSLTPPVLRYRLDGEAAEVARLTPRLHEYQTERGLWGRPGGHFAHGLRLDPAELRALACWPAGLLDAPFWVESDPTPSLGRPPEPAELPARMAPDRPSPGPDAPAWLSRLLAATARAAREGRTLFLVDAPDRLAGWVALLTFAFPAPLRAGLTFSTYHDRPEELPGFRIQGTVASARPNRPALLSLGAVADLAAGTLEPALDPPPWAEALAAWLLRWAEADRAAWSATDARAGRARMPDDPAEAWSDDWLGPLVASEVVAASPTTATPGWEALGAIAGWSAQAGLSAEWARVRGAGWWRGAADPSPEARRALLAHGRPGAAWAAPGAASAWGEAVARAFAEAAPDDRDAAVVALLKAAPPAERPAYVAALLRTLPEPVAAAVLDRLRTEPACDRAALLPREVRGAVSRLAEGDAGPIRALLLDALARPGAAGAVLDEVRAESEGRNDLAGRLAAIVAGAAGAGGAAAVERWALGLGGEAAPAWLGPYLRERLADASAVESWRRLRDRTPAPLRPAMARAVLTAAADPALPPAGFRWGVEEVLLAIDPPARPADPAWPTTYLARCPSDLDLLKRLYVRAHRVAGLPEWLDEANARGELGPGEVARLANVRAMAKALRSGEARAMLDVRLDLVPPGDRGPLLGQFLGRVDSGNVAVLDLVLGACRVAWPGGFEPGAPGLADLGSALADARWLAEARGSSVEWLSRLGHLAGVLGQEGPAAFAPDGLAAAVAASTARRLDPDGSVWPFRQALFNNAAAWRLPAEDFRRAVAEAGPGGGLELARAWEYRISGDRARFFEVALNAADGATLSQTVAHWIRDLNSLQAGGRPAELPWWGSAAVPGAIDDIRDRFARLAPMAPIPVSALEGIRRWIARGRAWQAEATPAAEVADFLPEDDAPVPTARPAAGSPCLSPFGEARWRCLDAMSAFHREGLDAGARWSVAAGWTKGLPLGELDPEDRHRFVAWMIDGLDADGADVARLGYWLVRSVGIRDVDRVGRWAEELEGLADVPGDRRLSRAGLVGELKAEMRSVLRDLRGG